ncbi:MAG: FecR domain-containing protein [Massilibacteroides sp.]|nr:FecR domain-containing protein [Massilibacteroides sp.]MDD3061871.1 FecR domain-containing protein [Massilibacteroides sp.]MDD4115151.1 FecR domain-containing protein [Massilibacteroides sp.]MDD4661252.1 FecR domain-containing protein [Massilibacteroides sp.]
MENEKNTRISKVIHQFLGNRFSEKTEEKVQRWLIEKDDSNEKEKASLAFWNTLEAEPNIMTYQSLKRVNAKTSFAKNKRSILFYRKLWRVAVVIIPFLMLAGGSYYLFQREQIIQITTAYGETRQIFLPDNSEVWLNSGTTIQYPKRFKNNTRKISLEGEAYFIVKRDTSRPFIVQTNNLSVKVLGTVFNVKAYPRDNKTIATLTSGKIEVETNTKQSRVLNPNEQLTYNSQTSDINIMKISATDASGWTSGQLIFTNASIHEIFETLERRFNVSFEIQKTIVSKDIYTVRFLKNDDLEQILSVLEDVIGGFFYQKDGKKIIISANKDI